MPIPARIASALIRLYRILVSPMLGERCRYYPSCSSYALEAVRTFGAARGFVLACWRIARCNPLSGGGVDHVCDQRVFGEKRNYSGLQDAHGR